MGLQMKEKQAVTREYRPRYQEAGKKEKSEALDQFIALTGYNRKYAVRVLNTAAVKPKAVRKQRPANRTGKRFYTDDVIDCLRRVWAFFHWKCGKLLAPLIRQQMVYIAAWPSFKITPEIKVKLLKINNIAAEPRGMLFSLGIGRGLHTLITAAEPRAGYATLATNQPGPYRLLLAAGQGRA